MEGFRRLLLLALGTFSLMWPMLFLLRLRFPESFSLKTVILGPTPLMGLVIAPHLLLEWTNCRAIRREKNQTISNRTDNLK